MVDKVQKAWLDGEFVDFDNANVHLLAHTIHYGLGAFEGIRAYQRHDGRTAIFRLREHMDRLIDSCNVCMIDAPYTREQIGAACIEVVRSNRIASCYLRPLVYLGYGALGLGSF